VRPDIAGPVPMPLHEQAPGERDGCPAPSGCARPAVKRVRIVRPSSLIEPGNRLVMPLRRTVVEPTPLAFGAIIFVRYASDFCLLAAAARNGESVPLGDIRRLITSMPDHDGGGILSNFRIELRLCTHASCERTNSCLRGNNSLRWRTAPTRTL
jgi:hypothetical protein